MKELVRYKELNIYRQLNKEILLRLLGYTKLVTDLQGNKLLPLGVIISTERELFAFLPKKKKSVS